MMHRPVSDSIFQASCGVIPGGVNSPVRAFPGLAMTPLIAARGEGDTIWDEDGRSYIDYCGSWGALILGHAPPSVVEAACRQVQRGSSFGIATHIEQKLASRIKAHLPSIEKIRFVSSGTEASMSAIRLARGFTGRSKIIKFDGHYHGHTDSLLIQAGSGAFSLNSQASSLGVPADMVAHTVSLPFNDIERVRAYFRHAEPIAAVIVEPIAGNMGVVPASKEFLEMLREETQKNGALLIFDEVITGFRVGLKGAQHHYGVTPDLTCLGKIIGGGFPAAAWGGSAEIMDHLAPLGQVYQAGTLSGNPVAMQAGYHTLAEVEREGFYEELEEITEQFLRPIRKAMEGQGCIQSIGSMFTLFFGPERVGSREDLSCLNKARFQQFFTFLFERGVYIPPSAYEACFISTAHTAAHLQVTQDLMLDFILNN
jgi:glutamate-1-semialdehyde 2,1-aminomutase